MGFGVSKKLPFFYRNSTLIIFITLVLSIISIDTVNRYFSLLSIEDLQNSTIYGFARLVLFLFLLTSYFFDGKKSNVQILKVLYFYGFFAIISIFINSSSILELLRSITFAGSLVLIFRYGILYGISTKNTSPIVISILFLVIVLLFQFFKVYLFQFSSIFIISNDAIFSLVVFVPFLFLLKNKKLMVVLIIMICLCTLFSQKRSVIIFVNLSVIIASFIYSVRASKIKLLAGGVFVLLLFFFYSQKKSSFLSSAMTRFENDGSNGRNSIRDRDLSQIYEGDLINNLFGFGYEATLKRNGVPSHNDFIEIAYDFGLFSFLTYLAVIIMLGIKCIQWFKFRLLFMDYYLAFVVAYIILLGLSLFNSMIFSTYSMVLFLSLGMSYGRINSIKQS